MDLLLDLDTGDGGLADRLYRQLATAIAEQRLRPGEPLPASRELAVQLQISRATVTLAYERLVAEGYCTARVGAGTFVSDAPARPVRHPAHRPALRGIGAATYAAPRGPEAPAPAYDFRVGVPDANLFPLAAWRRHVTRELDAAIARGARYPDSAGSELLRIGIAHHLGLARSVRTDADGVVLTAGAQQGIDLLARVLLRPGDVVAVEEPGYPPVRRAFEANGARIVPMPVDAEGADPTGLPSNTRLVYVTPSHQFPMGVVMSRARRLQLLDWAAARGALVIEDDYDSEHRFTDRPLEPLHVLDRDGLVAYVGTFSKALLPSLRVGYVIPPAQLVAPLRAAREIADGAGDPVTQGALGRLIDSGEFGAHMRRVRRVYRARHAALTQGLGALAPALRPVPSSAGLHVCVELPGVARGTAQHVQEAAAVAGVAVSTLDRFCVEDPREGLVLGFGAIPAEQIPDGLRVLGRTLHRFGLDVGARA